MKLYIALDNVRSLHNVGAIMRTALGFELDGLFTIGVTPHPRLTHDTRLPHVIAKAERAIQKTALGGEVLFLNHFQSANELTSWAVEKDLAIISLEKTENSVLLADFTANGDTVLVVGSETEGVSRDILLASSRVLHIPISPQKESYNVATSAGIAMYALHAQFAKLQS